MLAEKRPDITKHYSHFYDEGASEWRRLGALGKARNIMDLCTDHRFTRVIEIGAGDGAILDQLSQAKFALSFTALEVSESAVDVIRGRNIDNLDEVILFDGYSAPCKDADFDLSILSHVVEHVEHPRLLLREASRVAEYLYVEVPLELKMRTPRNFEWNNTGHINIYSPLTIRHLIQSTGLEILKERVTISSYDVHRYSQGKLAPFRYALKWLALRAVPSVATGLFTYHWSALCRSSN